MLRCCRYVTPGRRSCVARWREREHELGEPKARPPRRGAEPSATTGSRAQPRSASLRATALARSGPPSVPRATSRRPRSGASSSEGPDTRSDRTRAVIAGAVFAGAALLMRADERPAVGARDRRLRVDVSSSKHPQAGLAVKSRDFEENNLSSRDTAASECERERGPIRAGARRGTGVSRKLEIPQLIESTARRGRADAPPSCQRGEDLEKAANGQYRGKIGAPCRRAGALDARRVRTHPRCRAGRRLVKRSSSRRRSRGREATGSFTRDEPDEAVEVLIIDANRAPIGPGPITSIGRAAPADRSDYLGRPRRRRRAGAPRPTRPLSSASRGATSPGTDRVLGRGAGRAEGRAAALAGRVAAGPPRGGVPHAPHAMLG